MEAGSGTSVVVWLVAAPEEPAVLTPLLAPGERAWVDQAGVHVVRAATRVVLRRQLGEQLGVDPLSVELVRTCRHCGNDAHGKPSVSGAVEFSVSHTAGLGVVALSGGMVLGVDIERGDRPRRQARRGLYQRVLSPEERAVVEAMDDDAGGVAFLRLWAAKEAVAKADGRGITIGLGSLDCVSLLGQPSGAVATDTASWYVQEVVVPPAYAAYLASEHPVSVEVRTWQW